MSSNPDKPGFFHLPTRTIVFAQGYPADELQPLDANYWAEREKADAIERVKKDAEDEILKIAPLWKQINDIREPTVEGAARLAAINAIRAKSNEDEALIKEKKNG